jgi:BASS family bile acid:Na+ symporter
MAALLGIAAPVTTFTLLLAIGMELAVEDFASLRAQRLLVFAGLFAPFILLPAFALALTRLLNSPPESTLGVLLIAASPIGSVSNTYCSLGRASMALSITLTGLSSLVAGIALPLTGMALQSVLARPFNLQLPFGLMAVQLLLLLALPVALGMTLRGRAPAFAATLGPRLQRWSVTGSLVVLILVVLDDVTAFVGELSTTVPLAAAFVLASVVAGWTIAALITSDRRDRFTILSEFGARNVAVATAIAVTILGRPEFARFAAAYAFVELPLMLTAVALFRRSQAVRTA